MEKNGQFHESFAFLANLDAEEKLQEGNDLGLNGKQCMMWI